MPESLSLSTVQKRSGAFGRLHTLDDLCVLLNRPRYQLTLLAQHPVYQCFEIPKKSGGFRSIEDPVPPLKKIQRKLNEYLQSAYHIRRTAAAFAFQIGVENDKHPRNILTNAQPHLNRPYLLNADFLDFFHYVHFEDVYQIFQGEVFDFDDELAKLLTQLTTYNGRLPMGAPSSPVLSNFATIALDNRLMQLAKENDWAFTRFADDLTFSALAPFQPHHLNLIRQIADEFGYVFNEKKVKFKGPDDEKTVTGLRLGEAAPELPTEFVEGLNEDISKLRTVTEIQYRTGKRESKWVERFKQQVKGQLAFAEYVLDSSDPGYQLLLQSYEHALDPPELFGPVKWNDFNYI